MSKITVTHTLKYPLEWGKETFTELTFRRPKGKDLYHISERATNEDLAKLAGKLLIGEKVNTAMIGELDVEDFTAVMAIVGNFVDPSPETGEQPGEL